MTEKLRSLKETKVESKFGKRARILNAGFFYSDIWRIFSDTKSGRNFIKNSCDMNPFDNKEIEVISAHKIQVERVGGSITAETVYLCRTLESKPRKFFIHEDGLKKLRD